MGRKEQVIVTGVTMMTFGAIGTTTDRIILYPSRMNDWVLTLLNDLHRIFTLLSHPSI